MLTALGSTLHTIREEKGVKRVHVAAALDVTESSVWRVEVGKGWPRDPDRFLAAYEKVCKVPADEIWKRALAVKL
jgi:hypothetical protein